MTERDKQFNYIAYFESNEEKMVIVFPTNLEYYFNINQTITREHGDCPVLEDEKFILENGENGCLTLLEHINDIVKPYESDFHREWYTVHEIILSFKKNGISNKFIFDQLKKSEVKKQIISNFDKKINRTRYISNAMGASFIAGFNYYAEAKGLTQIPSYLSYTMPLITEIVLKAIYNSKYEELIVELTKDVEGETDALGLSNSEDEYNSLKELEEQIEILEDTSVELLEYLKLDGLKIIIDTNTKIRSLIMSSKPIEEINMELKGLYDSLE